jgi:hypothetical protein
MQDSNHQSSGLSKAAATICQMDPEIADFLHLLMTRSPVDNLEEPCGKLAKNVFERPTAQDLDGLLKVFPSRPRHRETPSLPMVDSHLGVPEFIPMRAFRSDAERVWAPVEKLRIFLSSGTTSGPERRSRSVFSHEGLLFYRAESIAAYLSALETRAQSFSANFLDSPIFSLIPPPDVWPDSSLSQMLAWFAKFWPTTYAHAENLSTTKEQLQALAQSKVPVVIWGTGFHFVNLFDDQTFQVKLPKGSIVIETGGTKGKSRSVTRPELYDMISRGFGLEHADIISEYGMCELAAQAWDTPKKISTDLKERVFRFPWWVNVAVMSKPNASDQSGVGALTIFDPLRIDLPGLALQTEDLAQLNPDQSFTLLGRVPTAPLKGCSLNVESVKGAEKIPSRTKSKAAANFYKPNVKDLSARALVVRRWLLNLLSDAEAHRRLVLEFGDAVIARKALTDLTAGLPFDAKGFADAALASIGQGQTAKNWLIIPPASHSIAVIYPICCALTLGLSIRIRCPSINQMSPDASFLKRAIDLAKADGFDIKTLPSSWRLGPNDLLDGESILIFGDDETCRFVSEFSSNRASTFGNVTSMSMVTGRDFQDSVTRHQILADQLSLGQRGCLSSRAIITIGGSVEIVKDAMTTASLISSREESIAAKTARSMEIGRLTAHGFEVFTPADGVTVAIKNVASNSLGKEIQNAVSTLDFVIPILLVDEITDKNIIISELLKISSLKALSVSDEISKALSKTKTYPKLVNDVRLVRLGTLGAPSLDGHHLGRPFFAT